MALRDRAIKALRNVFGAEREERSAADSPSAAALAAQPPSMFAMFGQHDVGGLLSVSQALIDRYADYEAMEEYPDIACIAEGCRVYVVDRSIATPVPIEQVAAGGGGLDILAFDLKKEQIVVVQARDARLSGRGAEVVEVGFSDLTRVRCTKDHKFLTMDGYVEAQDLTPGIEVVAMPPGFNRDVTCATLNRRPSTLTVIGTPRPAGTANVYDITTDTHNFVCEGIVVHNSAFRYYASDATQPSIQNNRSLWVEGDSDAVIGILDDMIAKRLRAEDEIWSQAYSLAMYGNNFEEVLVTGNGVIGLNHLPAPTMRRVESLDGGLIGFVQDITGQFTSNNTQLRAMLAGSTQIPPYIALFEDWQVCHMRLRSTRRRSPYGVSISEPARWIWKRLVMMEDMAIIYRLNRIPRYAYYVDVTDVPPDRVEGFLRKAKRDLKKRPMVNPRSGRLDMRYNPMAHDEDYIIAVREGKELARVDIISAPDWQSTEDINYFKRMLHGSLNVPRAWLGQDEPIQNRGILSNEDVRAARITLNLQREVRNGYEFICRVHLAARGLNPYDPEFTVMMTAPSGIWELAAYEVLNARADYASRVQPFTSIRWIQENVLKLSDEEIKAIEKQAKKEKEAEMGGPPPGPEGMPPEGTPPEEGGPPPEAEREAAGALSGLETTGKDDVERAVKGLEGIMSRRQVLQEFDRLRKLEDWRYRESCKRHGEIMDNLGKLMENDASAFAQRERERRAFFNDLRQIAMSRVNGRLRTAPVGRGR